MGPGVSRYRSTQSRQDCYEHIHHLFMFTHPPSGRKYIRSQIIFANTLFKAVCYDPEECQVITAGTDRKVCLLIWLHHSTLFMMLFYVLSGRLVTGRPMTAPKLGNWMEAARAVSMDSMSGVAALYPVAVTSSLSFGRTTKGRSLISVGAMCLLVVLCSGHCTVPVLAVVLACRERSQWRNPPAQNSSKRRALGQREHRRGHPTLENSTTPPTRTHGKRQGSIAPTSATTR